MVCPPVLSIIHSLKLVDHLSVQAHKPCSVSHLFLINTGQVHTAILLVLQVALGTLSFPFTFRITSISTKTTQGTLLGEMFVVSAKI